MHDYRWRLGLASGERKYDDLEERPAGLPPITVPTITMESDANGAIHAPSAAYHDRSSGKYEYRLITGGVGHDLPQEALQAFAQAVTDVDGFFGLSLDQSCRPIRNAMQLSVMKSILSLDSWIRRVLGAARIIGFVAIFLIAITPNLGQHSWTRGSARPGWRAVAWLNSPPLSGKSLERDKTRRHLGSNRGTLGCLGADGHCRALNKIETRQKSHFEKKHFMQRDAHTTAAYHHERAAKSHHAAALESSSGAHDDHVQRGVTACGHSFKAHEASKLAHEKSVQRAESVAGPAK